MSTGWLVLVLVALSLGFYPALAIDHSGTIASDENWSAADNPHNVISNVTLSAGVTLTLDPGVEVFFNNSTRINVYGDLMAEGTSGSGITFSRGGTSTWYGLRFLTAGEGVLDYCTIEGASYGVDMSSDADVSVAHSTIQQCTYGIRATSGDVELASVIMTDNTNFGFHGNGIAPTFLDGNCEFIDSGTGLHIQDVPNLTLNTSVIIRDNVTVGLAIDGCEDPTIDNLVLTGNSGPNGAMILTDTGVYTLGGGNTIGGGGDENTWPVTVTMGSYASPGSVIPTSGNDNDAIQVTNGSSTRTGTWLNFPGIDYVVTGNPSVAAAGELTIADGITVIFDGSRRINVYGDLLAPGSVGDGIQFTRRGTGTWYGLRFLTAGSGLLENCNIEYCSYGIDMSSNGTVSLVNSVIQNCTYGIRATDGDVELTSVIVSDNTSYGFHGNGVMPTLLDANCAFVDCSTGVHIQNIQGLTFNTPVSIRDNITVGLAINGCDDPTLDNLTLTGNSGTNGAMLLTDTGVFTLGAGNVIGGSGSDENTWPVTITLGSYPSPGCVIPSTGNESNDIQVVAGASTRSGSWLQFDGLDYVVNGSPSVSAAGELTIADGVNVYFGSSSRLNIYGELIAEGTSGNGIEFTRSGSGTWYGLRFLTAGHGAFDHCNIEHASYGIDLSSNGTVTMANTTIHDCTYGIRASNGEVELTSVSVTDNTSYGFHGSGVAPVLLDANCEFVDCATGVLIQDIDDLQFITPVTISNNTTVGLSIDNCDDPTLDNLTLLDNNGANGALLLTDTGEFTLGAGNVIGGGSGDENTWPVTITMGSYASEDCVIPTTGNDNNAIKVIAGSSTRSGTWRSFPDLHYVVSGSPAIAAAGELTIAHGVNVEFENSARINVYGELIARAGSVGGITFTRRGTGTWYGLRFLTAGHGELDLCSLQYASYGIDHSSNGTVDLSRTSIQDCNYGVRASNGTISFTNNRIFDNTGYGVYLSGANPQFGTTVSEWNDILDNGNGQAGRNLRNGPTDISANYVWWGTTVPSEVEEGLWHEPDDNNLGLIDWDPYCSEEHDIIVTGIDDEPVESNIPSRFALHQNHPNPFNAHTTIRFDLPRAADVRLDLYDITGAWVVRLVSERLPAKAHAVSWNGTDGRGRTVASGIYFYRIDTGDQLVTRRLMLVK